MKDKKPCLVNVNQIEIIVRTTGVNFNEVDPEQARVGVTIYGLAALK